MMQIATCDAVDRKAEAPQLEEPAECSTDQPPVPSCRLGASPEVRERKEIAFREGKRVEQVLALLSLLLRRGIAARVLSRRLGTCDLLGGPVARRMKKIDYDGYRFPPAIIQQAIWLYFQFTLSFRDVEDLLAERGITVSYETVRRWVNHFGPMIAADLRKRRPKPYTAWHLDEVYLKISPARSICGALSTPRARSSTCWSSPSETSVSRST